MSLLHSFVTPAPCRSWKMAPAVVPLSGTDLVTYCDANCPRLAFSKHSSSTASSLSSSTHVTSRRGILKRSRPEKSVPVSRQAVADMGLAAEERPVEQQSSAGAQEESWSVHKFGSSCVASAEMILRVSDIILGDASLRKIVSVSAISEANDMIRDILEKAQSQDYTYVDCLEEIRFKHASAAIRLLETGKDLDDFLNVLEEDVSNLSTLLRMVYIDGHATKAASDFVAGYGDAWSAQMLAAAVRKRGLSCVWLDSRKVFSTSPTSSNETDSIETDREFKFSLERLSSWYAESGTDTIIASGLGSTYPDDLQISLKLEGNDFAAAIEGALFSTHSASWSDVKNASNTSLRKAIAGQNSSSILYQEPLNMGQRMIRSQDVKDESASFGYKSEYKDLLRSSYGDEFPNQAESVTGATTIQAEFKALPDLDYLEELLAIQQSGPKAIGFFGTRNMGFMHQQLIEILSYAMVITKNHIFTSGASGTNAAVIRGALRAERPDLLTVILPQSLKRQPPESQELLSKVKNVIEMPHNDLLPLLEASRLCNMDILSHVQQVICFAFHDSNLLMETCREAKNLRKIVTLFYLD